MTANEPADETRAKVVAAAYAAASWARARRATWTDAPLPPVALAPPRDQVEVLPLAPPPTPAPQPLSTRPTLPTGPRTSLWTETIRPAIGPWLPRIAIAATVIVLVAVGFRYARSAATRITSKVAQAVPQSAAPPPTKGVLRVNSTPAGARVVIDGTDRGVTPLTLDDLPPGRHTVTLQSPDGTIQRSVAVAPGQVAVVDESIFSGWVAIYSPFELTVSEGNRALRPDERNEIMLGPGRHDLRLVNTALQFEEVRRVDLKPGQRVTISITPPRSSVSVTSSEPAEVWLDGARVGATPLNAPAALGTHEIVVRRAGGGERRFTVRVTVKPLLLTVDFSKPGP